VSDHASVVIVWSTIGEQPELEDNAYQAKYANGLADIATELGGYVNGIIWGCGAGGDTMVCENVAQIAKNHLNPDKIWPAIRKAAPFLADPDQETEVLFKTEQMERYLYAMRV